MKKLTLAAISVTPRVTWPTTPSRCRRCFCSSITRTSSGSIRRDRDDVPVVRVWDAFADLAAGRLVDITNTRWGKFRPYLLFASLPLLLSSVAVQRPNFDSTTAKYIYAYVTYALLGFLYSLTNIPFGSLATAMTQDPVERSRLGIGARWGRSSASSSRCGDRSPDHPISDQPERLQSSPS